MPYDDSTFFTLAENVARELGATMERPSGTSWAPWYVCIYTDGWRLHVWRNPHEKRLKVSVAPHSFRDANGIDHTLHASDLLSMHERKSAVTEIGCSESRSAQAIAKDITRRLLPAAKMLHERALKTAAERIDASERQRETVSRFVMRFGYRESTHSAGVGRLYPSDVDLPRLEVNGPEYVRIEYFHCDAETAEMILELLTSLKKKKKS